MPHKQIDSLREHLSQDYPFSKTMTVIPRMWTLANSIMSKKISVLTTLTTVIVKSQNPMTTPAKRVNVSAENVQWCAVLVCIGCTTTVTD